MAQTYTVLKRDTLSSIARKFYGDAKLGQKLADFNGLRDANLVFVGQHLQVPTRRELLGEAPTGELQPAGVTPPNGLQEIIGTFGDISHYLADGILSPEWVTDNMVRIDLPFPLVLSWDHSQKVTKFQCHKRMQKIFSPLFARIVSQGLQDKIKSFGGCYSYRPQRASSKLSTHSWGIAIDLNPETNAQGSAGDMDPEVVAVFRSFGFKWGGDWAGKRKDAMHFQFCTGY